MRQRSVLRREFLREVLREVTDSRALAVRQRARREAEPAAERSQQRGLSRPVWSDDEKPVSSPNRQIHACQQRLEPAAVAHGGVCQREGLLGALGGWRKRQRHASRVAGTVAQIAAPARLLRERLDIFANALQLSRATPRRRRGGRARAILRHEPLEFGRLGGRLRRGALRHLPTLSTLDEKLGVIPAETV